MKVGLYEEPAREIMSGISETLSSSKIETEVRSGCLCQAADLSGLDIIMSHPHIDSIEDCWKNIADLIRTHTRIQFYIMEFNQPRRREFFERYQTDNLYYLDYSNIERFKDDPESFLKRGYEEFQANLNP